MRSPRPAPAGRPGRRRAVVAGRDPGDVGAVLGLARVERQLRVALVRAGRREGAGDDHLGRRVRRVALREAAGIENPAGEKNGCVRSMPSSITPIFIPSPALARSGPRPAARRSPPGCGRASGGSGRSGGPREPPGAQRSASRRPGRDDREAVEHDPVAPADARARHRLADARGDLGLLSLDAACAAFAGRGLALQQRDELHRGAAATGRPRRRGPRAPGRARPQRGREDPCSSENRRYTVPPRGCGGIGRRARFRSVWG